MSDKNKYCFKVRTPKPPAQPVEPREDDPNDEQPETMTTAEENYIYELENPET